MDCYKNLIIEARKLNTVEEIIELARLKNINLDYDAAAIILININANSELSDEELLAKASSYENLERYELKVYDSKETVRYIKNISDDIVYVAGLWGYTLKSKVVKREAKYYKNGPLGEGWYDEYHVYGQEYTVKRDEILK